jgi:hypothetical protein
VQVELCATLHRLRDDGFHFRAGGYRDRTQHIRRCCAARERKSAYPRRAAADPTSDRLTPSAFYAAHLRGCACLREIGHVIE